MKKKTDIWDKVDRKSIDAYGECKVLFLAFQNNIAMQKSLNQLWISCDTFRSSKKKPEFAFPRRPTIERPNKTIQNEGNSNKNVLLFIDDNASRFRCLSEWKSLRAEQGSKWLDRKHRNGADGANCQLVAEVISFHSQHHFRASANIYFLPFARATKKSTSL